MLKGAAKFSLEHGHRSCSSQCSRKTIRGLRGRLELGPPVGFFGDRFLIAAVGNKSKFVPPQKIKKRVKSLAQAKAFGNISFYDRYRPVHSAREVIKINLALPMAHSILRVPILAPAFVLFLGGGKAANASQWGWAFLKIQRWRPNIGCKCPTPGQHQYHISQSFSRHFRLTYSRDKECLSFKL